MRPSRHLRRLRHAGRRKLGTISLLVRSATTRTWHRWDAAIALATLESLNTWSEFARGYYLSCVIGTRLELGHRVTVSNRDVVTLDDAIDEAIRLLRPQYHARTQRYGSWRRRDEPVWHDPRTLLHVCHLLGVSHEEQVRAALSIQTKVFRCLPTFRNVYAHRNPETATKALRIAASEFGIVGVTHPTQALCTRPAGWRQPLLLDLLSDLRGVMELLSA